MNFTQNILEIYKLIIIMEKYNSASDRV